MIDHPAEDLLVECALCEGESTVLEHVEHCPRCSEFVGEVRAVTRDIAAIDDEPVPERVCARILAIAHNGKPDNFVQTFLQTWYRKPFIIGLATIALVLLLYTIFILNL